MATKSHSKRKGKGALSNLLLQDRNAQPPAPLVDSDYFPEQLFPAAAEVGNSYLADTARGYSRMASKRVVIGGLARDLGGIIDSTIARIERLGRLFADYRVVIYENDSEDQTRPKLQEWGLRNPRVLLQTENLDTPVNQSDRSIGRAQRMAYYRRQCHREICQRFGNFDNVVLVDMDLEGGWSFDGVANTFGKNEWDFVGSNGVIYRRHRLDLNRLVHFDAWAYRTDEAFSPKTTAEVNALSHVRGESMVPVTSCFGGLGVYRMDAFQAGEYDEHATDMEHVPFHRSMRNRGFGRTFLNPSQIVLYGRRHRTYDQYAVRVRQFMDRILGRQVSDCLFERGVTQLRDQLCEQRRVA